MVDHTHKLNFDRLTEGELGISAVYGSFLAEAAGYCLNLKKHPNPVTLSLTGDDRSSRIFQWSSANRNCHNTYGDLQEATEYGACGIAIIVAVHLTGIGQVERSAKGTGIDYWFGEDSGEDGLFQRSARLEVSGILEANENKISARLSQKMSQTQPSDKTLLPAYVAIVGFNLPETRFVKKNVQGRGPL
jgi:hypothetical protein